MRHQQPSLWETFFAEEVAELWEPWMRAGDEVLEDDELLVAVFAAQGHRHSQSRSRGRHQTPAEVVLRMLILKHVRNWSYETLGRPLTSVISFTLIQEEILSGRIYTFGIPIPCLSSSTDRISILFSCS